jgi:hypothetical protein
MRTSVMDHTTLQCLVLNGAVLLVFRGLRNPSTASDLSTSSNEDRDEEQSGQIFSAILDNIASSPEYLPLLFGIQYRSRILYFR